MPRNVEVPNTFYGPLDLLLYLVRRDEIDLHNIPLAHLTREYLAELEKMPLIDVNAGGEFVAMATILLEMKSRELAPIPLAEGQETDDDEVLFDPRQGLVQALLEYKYFKQVAGELEQLAATNAARFPRRLPPPAVPAAPVENEPQNSLELFAAFQKFVQKMLAGKAHEKGIINEEVATEVRIQQIETAIAQHEHTTFSQLLSAHPTRDEIVGFFIAVLELVRMKKISARQAADFSEIHLTRRQPEPSVGAAVSASPWQPLHLATLFFSAAKVRRQPSAAVSRVPSPITFPPLIHSRGAARCGTPPRRRGISSIF